MSLKSFLGHYAAEAGKIANALSTIASGIALGNNERGTVMDTVETLENAVTNILAGIDKITDPVVKISKADIETAVAKVLPKVLEEQVTAAVTAALAAKAADEAATDAEKTS